MNDFDRELRDLRLAEDFGGVIRCVREAVTRDRLAAMTHWQVKDWCGKRWRNLFLTEAVKDETALVDARSRRAAKRKNRSDREWIARKFLRDPGRDEAEVEMPPAELTGLANTTFIFCPGLLNGLLPVRAFQTSLPEIEKEYGIRVLRADLHPLAGCDKNAESLAATIEKGLGLTADREVIAPDEAVPPGDVFLMGYSKGMADIVTLLATRPDLATRIRCVFGWAGAAGGSYVGDEAWKQLKDLEEDPERRDRIIAKLSPLTKLPEIVERRLDETDIKTALLHLTTKFRQAFLHEHENAINDLGIPIFNLVGSTNALEVPTFQIQGAAQLLPYDPCNDMQVTQDQARLRMPMATDLATLHAHHWDLAYEAFPKNLRRLSPHLDHPFPKKAALLANIQLAHELGLID